MTIDSVLLEWNEDAGGGIGIFYLIPVTLYVPEYRVHKEMVVSWRAAYHKKEWLF